jgi:hypothetical protein
MLSVIVSIRAACPHPTSVAKLTEFTEVSWLSVPNGTEYVYALEGSGALVSKSSSKFDDGVFAMSFHTDNRTFPSVVCTCSALSCRRWSPSSSVQSFGTRDRPVIGMCDDEETVRVESHENGKSLRLLDEEHISSISFGNERLQVVELYKGWTWFSLSVAAPDLLSTVPSPSHGDMLMTQQTFVVYDAVDGSWRGTFSNDEATERGLVMYRQGQSVSMPVTGQYIINSSMSALEGWSWLPVHSRGRVDVNDISIHTSPDLQSPLNEGQCDIVKTQIHFAQYYEGFGWFGSLHSVEEGDMLKLRCHKDMWVHWTGN